MTRNAHTSNWYFDCITVSEFQNIKWQHFYREKVLFYQNFVGMCSELQIVIYDQSGSTLFKG